MATPEQIHAALVLAADLARTVNDRDRRKLTTTLIGQRTAAAEVTRVLAGVDVATYLKTAYVKDPAADVTAPTTPGTLVATLVGNDVQLVWGASTDAVGVTNYEVWQKLGTGGTYALLASPSNTSYLVQGLNPTQRVFHKVLAMDRAGNPSGFGNETDVTIPGGSTVDVTAPPVPATPVLVSKDTTNVRIAITPVNDTNPGDGSIVTGTLEYPITLDGVALTPAPHPDGILSAITSKLIGEPSPAGSYSVLSGVHTFTGVGGADWYGTQNSLRIASAPGKGPLEIIGRIVSITSANPWAKAGIALFDGIDPQSRYFAMVSVGVNGINGEFRPDFGGQAQQFTRKDTITLPIYFRITRNAEGLLTGYYSPTNGDWLFQGSQAIGMSDIVEVGFGACGNGSTATVVIDNVTINGESPVLYSLTIPPSATPLSHAIRVASRDKAATPNTSSYGTALNVTPDATSAVSPSGDHPFKSLYIIGGDQSYRSGSQPDPLFVSRAKRCRYVVFSGSYEGKEQGNNGVTDAMICQAVKDASTVGTKLGKYVNMNEQKFSGGWFPTYRSYVDANNSWLWNAGTSGTRTPSAFYPADGGNVNVTAYGPTDGEGLKPYEWAARFAWRMYRSGYYAGGIGSAANPYLDALFLDNCFWRPRVNGAWPRTGGALAWNATLPNGDSVHLAWRKGVRTFFAWLKANTDLKSTGNIADWGEAIDEMGSANAGLSQLAGYLDGGDIEFFIGGYSSPELWAYPNGGGFSTVLRRFIGARDNILDHRYLIATHGTVLENGSDGIDSTPGRAAGYGQGFVSCFSNGGYENEANTGDVHDAAHAYEFPEQYGGYLNTYGWLGTEVTPYLSACNISAAASSSTYGMAIREFAKGYVVLNPKGNGAKSRTATQLFGSDTAVRDIKTGAAVSGSVAFADREARFFAKRSVYG